MIYKQKISKSLKFHATNKTTWEKQNAICLKEHTGFDKWFPLKHHHETGRVTSILRPKKGDVVQPQGFSKACSSASSSSTNAFAESLGKPFSSVSLPIKFRYMFIEDLHCCQNLSNRWRGCSVRLVPTLNGIANQKN